MKTVVPEHISELQHTREFYLKMRSQAIENGEIIPEMGDELIDIRHNIAERQHEIINLSFALPVRHQVYPGVRWNLEDPEKIRINKDLDVHAIYLFNVDRWSFWRSESDPHIEGDTMAEAWESFLEWLADSPEEEGAGVVLDSQYDDWVDGLEQGEELVDIAIYEALNAGNPVIWSGSKFVEWMKSKEGP